MKMIKKDGFIKSKNSIIKKYCYNNNNESIKSC